MGVSVLFLPFSLLLLFLIALNGLALSLFPQRVAYHDESVPGCEVLNYEKSATEEIPSELVVNGTRYRVLGQIQHGATSKVYHVLEEDDHGKKRCLAIKVVEMSKLEEHLQSQVRNEATLLAELNERKLERIPLLFTMEHTPSSQQMSLVLELAHHDLFDEISANMGRGRYSWVRQTLAEILRAMQPVHESEIVHADVKPENMAYFRTAAGELMLKIIDFGGSIRTDQLGIACRQVVTGTIMYMSPEQLAWCANHGEEPYLERMKEAQLCTKSDMWSVGIILYQMLFGRNPYKAVLAEFEDLENQEERSEKTDKALRQIIFEGQQPIEFDDYEDRPLLEMLKRCLDRQPTGRPGVTELLAELEELGEIDARLKQLETEAEQKLGEEEQKRREEKEAEEEKKEEEDEAEVEEDGGGGGGKKAETTNLTGNAGEEMEEQALPPFFLMHVKNLQSADGMRRKSQQKTGRKRALRKQSEILKFHIILD